LYSKWQIVLIGLFILENKLLTGQFLISLLVMVKAQFVSVV